MAAEEEEEVLIEVEAVESVYGDDCLVVRRFPPHLQLHIKPRTADDSSQQFVESILELRAGSQYPKEPPQIGIIDSKGLDEVQQAHLITSIQEKVVELSSCLMLVALCEEAVQVVSQMNHPDGNCPLCLYPLVKEDGCGNSWPFMKLMSCYHCFHSKCIIKWWNWLQQQNETDSNNSNASLTRCSNLRNQTDLNGTVKNQGTCPVCRKVFQAMDIEHVLNLVQTYSSHLSLEETETNDDMEIHHSELENTRRKDFEALLKLQEENNGLIEPKRSEVLLPGVFLPVPVTPSSVSTEASAELQQTSPTNTPTSETGPSRPLNKAGTSSQNNSTNPTNGPTSETGPNRPFNKGGTSSRNNFGMRKNRPRNTRNTRPQNKQWVKKENANVGG